MKPGAKDEVKEAEFTIVTPKTPVPQHVDDDPTVLAPRKLPEPCPFCGGWNLRLERPGQYFKMHCHDCDIYGPAGLNPEGALLNWNTRKGVGMLRPKSILD